MQQRLGWVAAQVPCKHILTAGAVGRYNQTNSETGEKVVQEVAIPALLAEMQIARIKRVWEANKVGGGSRANSHEYLLTGRLRFGACGSVPVGTFKNNRRSYVHVWSEIKGPDCGRLVWADRAEVGTMDRIGDALRNEKSLARDIEAQLGSQHSRIAEVEQRIADRTKTIDELEAKILKKSDLDGIRNAARSAILRDINKLSGQLATAIEERDEAQGERAAIDTSKDDAQRIAEHIRYLIGGHVVATQWSKSNKERALAAPFGDDRSLRRKKGIGIYVDPKTGHLTLKTVFPLNAIISEVEPGELGRPRLPVNGVLPTRRMRMRCQCRRTSPGRSARA